MKNKPKIKAIEIEQLMQLLSDLNNNLVNYNSIIQQQTKDFKFTTLKIDCIELSGVYTLKQLEKSAKRIIKDNKNFLINKKIQKTKVSYIE